VSPELEKRMADRETIGYLSDALRRTREALAEVLLFVQDASNPTAPEVAAWHARHADAIFRAAKEHGREHLLSPPTVMPETVAETSNIEALTPRETQVLKLLTLGYSNKEIGRSLGMLEVTVKSHVRAVMKKLGVHNRTMAALEGNRRMAAKTL